jgi:hypothetical protein
MTYEDMYTTYFGVLCNYLNDIAGPKNMLSIKKTYSNVSVRTDPMSTGKKIVNSVFKFYSIRRTCPRQKEANEIK